MFKNLFKKKSDNSVTPAAEFLKARDMYSFAFHIQNPEGKPLCGTENAMTGRYAVTQADVLGSLHMQHSGWYWCASCGSIFTGESEQIFRDSRSTHGD